MGTRRSAQEGVVGRLRDRAADHHDEGDAPESRTVRLSAKWVPAMLPAILATASTTL